MKTIWLKSHIEAKEKSLDNLLMWLENKSQKNTQEKLAFYDIWPDNKVFAAMTRTPEIERESLRFISDLMKKTLEKTNPKAKIILEKLV